MAARRWGFRLAAVMLGVAAPLIAVEGYLRFTGAGGGFHEPDPILGARLTPNRTGRFRRPCFDVSIRINSRGLRDVEHQLEKPPGNYRIVVLGDSVAEALQVPLDASFPRRLESILNAGGNGPTAEVVNFGVSSYGTDQEYLSLKTRAAAYQPDLVVLTFTIWNDVRNNSPSLEHRMTSIPKPFFRLKAGGQMVPVAFEFRNGRVEKIKSTLRSLRLYHFLMAWVRDRASVGSLLAKVGLLRFAAPPPPANVGAAIPPTSATVGNLDFQVYRREPDPEWVEAWGVTEALIRMTRDEAARMGARFLLVPIPSASELATPEALAKKFPGYTPGEYDLAAPRERLRRLAVAEGMAYVDVFEAFSRELRARHGTVTDLYLWCDGHLTSRGHERVAEAIAARLRGGGGTPISAQAELVPGHSASITERSGAHLGGRGGSPLRH